MKNFLKVTKIKLLIAFLFFLVLPLWYTVQVYGGPNECQGLRTCVVGEEIQWVPLGGGIFFVVSIFVGGNQLFEIFSDYLLKTPYLLLASYFLAAGVVAIFSRKKR